MLQHAPEATRWTLVRRATVMIAVTLLHLVATANAGSTLLLPYPTEIGNIPAASYDAEGLRIGPAKIDFEEADGGLLRLIVQTAITDGARSRVEAEFEVVGDKQALRLLRERSEAHDAGGTSMGLLEVDHTRGEARCTPPGGGPVSVVPIPDRDRVANVPMNFLFLPLIREEVDEIRFQVFLCRGGARFINFAAQRASKPSQGAEPGIIRVRYGPDLGPMITWAASRLLPKLSFWFDNRGGGRYIAHRVPLFSGGPEVTVVREGFSPKLLVQ